MANYFDQFDAPAKTGGGNFFDKFDAAPEPPQEKSSALRRTLGDQVAVPLLKGVIGVPEAAVGILDLPTMGLAGRAAQAAGIDFKRAQDIASSFYSPEQQAANQRVAQAEGVMPTLKAAVENPSVILQQAVQNVPTMLMGGPISQGIRAAGAKFAPEAATALAARFGDKAPIALGAASEGLISAGQNAEQVRQEEANGLLSPAQSAILAASGIATGGIAYGGGRLARRMGLYDPETLLAAGKLTTAGEQKIPGLAARVAGGFLTEGPLQEAPQSYQEAVAQNLAQGKPWNEGATNQAVMGGLVGGLIGSSTNLLPPSGPIVKIADAADQTGATQPPLLPAPPITGRDATGDIPNEEQRQADAALQARAEAIYAARAAKEDELQRLGNPRLPAPAEGAPNVAQNVPAEPGEGPLGVVQQYAQQNAAERAAKVEQDRLAEEQRLTALGMPTAGSLAERAVTPSESQSTEAPNALSQQSPASVGPYQGGNESLGREEEGRGVGQGNGLQQAPGKGQPGTGIVGGNGEAQAEVAPVAQPGVYTVADPINGDGAETVRLIARPDGNAAIVRDDGQVIDVSNMHKAGFSAERMIAQAIGEDTTGKNVAPAPEKPAGPAQAAPTAPAVTQPATTPASAPAVPQATQPSPAPAEAATAAPSVDYTVMSAKQAADLVTQLGGKKLPSKAANIATLQGMDQQRVAQAMAPTPTETQGQAASTLDQYGTVIPGEVAKQFLENQGFTFRQSGSNPDWWQASVPGQKKVWTLEKDSVSRWRIDGMLNAKGVTATAPALEATPQPQESTRADQAAQAIPSQTQQPEAPAAGPAVAPDGTIPGVSRRRQNAAVSPQGENSLLTASMTDAEMAEAVRAAGGKPLPSRAANESTLSRLRTKAAEDSVIGMARQSDPKMAAAVQEGISKGRIVVRQSEEEVANEAARSLGVPVQTVLDQMQGPQKSLAGTTQGFFLGADGRIYLVAGKLNSQNIRGVLMHEATHGRNRAALNARAMDLIDGRANETPELRGMLDDVAARMASAKETGNAKEAMTYLVEVAGKIGSRSGSSAIDGKFMAAVDAVSERLGNFIREVVAQIRAWGIKRGMDLTPTVDDLVAIARSNVIEFGREGVLQRGQGEPQFSRLSPEEKAQREQEKADAKAAKEAQKVADKAAREQKALDTKVQTSAANEQRRGVAVLASAKPGDDIRTVTGRKGKNLQRLHQRAQAILQAKPARDLMESLGVKSYSLVTYQGSWKGAPEQSFFITALDKDGNALDFDKTRQIGALLAWAFQQDAAIVSEAIASPDPNAPDLVPALYVGRGDGKELTAAEVKKAFKAFNAAGMDASVTPDGKAIKFLYFDDAAAYTDYVQTLRSTARGVGLNGLHTAYNHGVLDSFNGGANGNVQGGYRQIVEGIGNSVPAAGSPGIQERATDSLLVPYILAVQAEGFGFDYGRWQQVNNATDEQRRSLEAKVAAADAANKHGLIQRLREKVSITRLPNVPIEAQIAQKTTDANAASQLDILDQLQRDNPDPLSSPEAYLRMQAHAYGSEDVPLAPRNLIAQLREAGAGIVNQLRGLTPGQLDGADAGFANGREFKRLYTSGKVPVETTGKLMLWSFLSRGVSPYTQEGMFIDTVRGIEPFVREAAKGNFGPDMQARYERWVDGVVAANGDAAPGNGTTHNLYAFGKYFLTRMSEPASEGKTKLQYLHDMLSDPKMSGRQIRREFVRMGQGVGIDNKVVSFTLLVTGRPDVVVLDRVQMRNVFDDGRFAGYNLYDGTSRVSLRRLMGKRDVVDEAGDIAGQHEFQITDDYGNLVADDDLKKLGQQGKLEAFKKLYGFVEQGDEESDADFKRRLNREMEEVARREGINASDLAADRALKPGSGLASLTTGVRGLMLYEAIEDKLNEVLPGVYDKLGRPQDASPGRWHWESWVAASGQEASHGTLDALLHEIEGRAHPFADVTVQQGEYGRTDYGGRYARDPENKQYFLYDDSAGKTFRFLPQAWRAFLAAVKESFPKRFKVTEDQNGRERTAPWFNDPRIDRAKIDEVIREHGEPQFSRSARDESKSEELVAAQGGEAQQDPGLDASDLLFSRRESPPPTNTVKAYKLFRVDERQPGKLFPLFVDAKTPVEQGVWYDAESGERTDTGKVKSKLGPLAYRPGWHAGDLPLATHIGEGGQPPTHRPANQVWAEVEMAADRDWQAEADRRGTNAAGKVVPVRAHIQDQIPTDGYYRYKTNPNMTGNWLIGGSIKVNRILSDAEVERINNAAGVADLPRKAPFDAQAFGLDTGPQFSRAAPDTPAPVWRSPLRTAIAQSKQESMPGQQWAMWLTGNAGKLGVKADELQWSGVTDWLKLQQGKVMKADIDAYLEQNGVKVEETMLGEGGDKEARANAASDIRATLEAGQVWDDNTEYALKVWSESEPESRLGKQQEALLEEYLREAGDNRTVAEYLDAGKSETDSTKFSGYRTPGGENYRELLLTLPEPDRLEAAKKAGYTAREASYGWQIVNKEGDGVGSGQGKTADEALADWANTAKSLAGGNVFRSSHWDQPNVLAHIRFDDRTDADGNRVLFINEIQSDWGQKGRKEGFASKPLADTELVAKVNNSANEPYWEVRTKDGTFVVNIVSGVKTAEEAVAEARDYVRRKGTSADRRVPSAPFISDTNAWTALALKRMIRYAAENGYDKIAWATGDQQFDLYGSQEIAWVKAGNGWRVSATEQRGGNAAGMDIEGEARARGILNETKGSPVTTKEQLRAVVANVLSRENNTQQIDKVVNRVWERMQTEDAGTSMPRREAMRAFYEEMVPQTANEVLKKVGGGRVETSNLVVPAGNGQTTPAGEVRWIINVNGREYNGYSSESVARDELRELQDAGENAELVDVGTTRTTSQPAITITPALREKAMEGMPLFSRSAPVGLANLTPEQQTAAKKFGVNLNPPTLKDRLRQLTADAGLKIEAGMFDAFAALKHYGEKAYALASLTKADANVLETALKNGIPYLTDAGSVMVRSDPGGFIGKMQALQGEHKRFLLWVAANRAKRLMAEGREHNLDADDIQALKALNQGEMNDGQARATVYGTALKDMERYNKGILDMAEKAGVIEGTHYLVVDANGKVLHDVRQLTQAQQLAKQNNATIETRGRGMWESEFYVPFYRDMEDGAYKGPTKKKGLVNQKGPQRLKGGEEATSDLLTNIMRNWSSLISSSLRNQAATEVLNKAEVAGVAYPVTAGEKAKGDVSILVNGKQQFYRVEDSFTLQAISAMAPNALTGVAATVMGKFKNALTLGVTASPSFRIRNLIRDSVHSVATSGVSKNIAQNVKDGYLALDPKSTVYQNMLAGGALMHFGDALEGNNAARIDRMINSGIKDSTILNTPAKVRAAMEAAWHWWEDVGSKAENVNRAAAYKAEYERRMAAGASEDEAHLYASLEARKMMDFSQQGSWQAIRFLAQTVPFFNARMVGMHRLGTQGFGPTARVLTGKASAADKAKALRLNATLGAITLAGIALMLAYRDDDDWKRREEWDRDNNWWFKIGDTAYRIPKPFEIGSMSSIAERGLEMMMDGMDADARKRFGDRFVAILWDNLSMNPTPQLVKPVADLYANKDSFTQRPIETLGMERLSRGNRIGPNTSVVAQKLGTDFLSPVQIDHLIQGYFGWLGTHTVMAADMALRPLSGMPEKPERKLGDYFVVGDFAKDLPSNQSRYLTQFYDQLKQTGEAYADYRNALQMGQPAKAQEILAEKRQEITLNRMYETQGRSLSQLNALIKRAEASDMSAADKRARIDYLTQQKLKIAERAATARKAIVERQ